MSRQKRIYAVTNLMVVVGVIIWNYTANAVGIKGNTVASLSEKYYNLFTPANYAFGIWGAIYVGLIAHSIYQVICAFTGRKDDFILRVGPWLIIANIGNAAWLWAWLSEHTGLSVLIILIVWLALAIIVVRLNMERWDAPLPVIIWVWWPFCIYSGWITVATIANVAAYLAKIEWQGFFSEVTQAVLMIIVATVINLLMILFRNMREFAAVGVWAIIAIAVRFWGDIPAIQWTAFGCALALTVAIMVHGYKNRSTSPLVKWRES